jgi:hypothetical protein
MLGGAIGCIPHPSMFDLCFVFIQYSASGFEGR